MIGNARLAHAQIRVEEGQQPRPFDLRESLGLAQCFHRPFQALIFSQRRSTMRSSSGLRKRRHHSPLGQLASVRERLGAPAAASVRPIAGAR